MGVFEKNTWFELAAKVEPVRHWFSGRTLFCTHQELAHLIEKFLVYLNDSKASIILAGRPQKRFRRSPYFYSKLASLYPDTKPSSAKNRDLLCRVVKVADDEDEETIKKLIFFLISTYNNFAPIKSEMSPNFQ